MGNHGDITHRYTIDPILFSLLDNVTNKEIYDIGCGNGYIARKLAKNGAKSVYAIDSASQLIELAKTKYPVPQNVTFESRDASNFVNIRSSQFDLILMNMVIHYIEHPEKLIAGISESLKLGGYFVFTTGHPLRQIAKLDLCGAKNPNVQNSIETAKSYIYRRKKTKQHNVWSGNYDLTIYFAPISYYVNLCSKYHLIVTGMEERRTVMAMNDVHDKTIVKTTIPMVYGLKCMKVKA